jgi:hypothetical protein
MIHKAQKALKTHLVQFDHESINMILPRQGAVHSDTQKPGVCVVNNIFIFLANIYLSR